MKNKLFKQYQEISFKNLSKNDNNKEININDLIQGKIKVQDTIFQVDFESTVKYV